MNSKGQALVEYVLIIALISVVVIGIVNTFGGYLKDAMTKHGFKSIPNEWWHFTLEAEPYPDMYFDFPVNSDSVGK